MDLNPDNDFTGQSFDPEFLAKKIREVRSDLPSDPKRSGNMAAADIRIGGDSSVIASHSSIHTPTTLQQTAGLIGASDVEFKTFSIPNKEGTLISRAGDSEAKILNHVATELGDNFGFNGTINIFTELQMCASCLGVRKQFTDRYPGIRVNVLDNSNIRIKPNQRDKQT